MDISGIIKNLHPLEIKVLLKYSQNDELTSARLQSELNYKEGHANQAFSWLGGKELIKEINRTPHTFFEITELGRQLAENGTVEERAVNFLKDNPDYQLINYPRLDTVTVPGIKIENYNTEYTKRRYPHLFKGEGQFMALLEKTGNEESTSSNESNFYAKGFESIYKKDLEILRKTFKDVADIKTLKLVKRNDNFFVLPETVLDFEELNVVSVGCLLGTLSKGTFKIAHEFYHSYGNLFNNTIELDNIQIIDYMKGYELDTNHPIPGICVIQHHGISLGGGKVVGDKIKNYYPKNLRNN